jgi:hypothetical protein
LLVVALILSSPVAAQFGVYHLRTEPAFPVSGQPFFVVVDSNICENFVLGDPYDEGRAYDEVTVSEDVIHARIGYFPLILCLNQPETFRLPVPPLPAGNYRMDLVGRLLFTTDDNLLTSGQVTVGGAGAASPRVVPTLGWQAVIMMVLCILGTGAGWRQFGRA